MKETLDGYLPLSPAAVHILLALSAEDRHGYGIMLEVQRQTDGRYKLGPGTLYDNLEKLLKGRMVGEVPRAKGEDPRRRYYRITAFGRDLLAADVARLEGIVRTARKHLRLARQA